MWGEEAGWNCILRCGFRNGPLGFPGVRSSRYLDCRHPQSYHPHILTSNDTLIPFAVFILLRQSFKATIGGTVEKDGDRQRSHGEARSLS